MLKQKKRKNFKLALLLATIVAVGVGACYFAFIAGNSDHSGDTVKTSGTKSPPTEAEKAARANEDAKQKEEYLDSDKNQGDTSPEQTNSSDNIKIDISRNGEDVVVKTNLGYIAEGTCTLTVSSGFSQTVNIIYAPEYSFCAGFTVARKNLSSGKNTLKLEVRYGDTVLIKTSEVDI
jgi:flagellar basal body-associated protein FliL